MSVVLQDAPYAPVRQQMIAASLKIREGRIWECAGLDAAVTARHTVTGHVVRVFSRLLLLALPAEGGTVPGIAWVTGVAAAPRCLVLRHETAVTLVPGPGGLVPGPGELAEDPRLLRRVRKPGRDEHPAGPQQVAALTRLILAAQPR